MSKESDHIAKQFGKQYEAQKKQSAARRKQDKWRESDCAIAWISLAWEAIRHVI